MTYIRTEDRIYKTDELTKCEDPRFPNCWFNSNGATLVAKKESDTIEELCDAYILCEQGNCCVIGDVEAKEMAATNCWTIYGAILVFGTDGAPTLKPVAKMNRKGELK